MMQVAMEDQAAKFCEAAGTPANFSNLTRGSISVSVTDTQQKIRRHCQQFSIRASARLKYIVIGIDFSIENGKDNKKKCIHMCFM